MEQGRTLNLVDGRLGPEDRSSRVETDDEGRFCLERPSTRYALLAIDPQGLVFRTAEEHAGSPILALRPWGRISGVVKLGTRPDPERSVCLNSSWNAARMVVAEVREVRSDAQGRFTFERVLPGPAFMARTFPSTDGMMSDLRRIDIEPGKTTEVAIGGVARPVEGRVGYPKGEKAPHFTSGRVILSRKQPPVPFPPENPPRL